MQEIDPLDYKWLPGEGTVYLKNFANESIYLEMPLVRLANKMLDMAEEGIPIVKSGNPKLAVLKELYPFGPKDWYIEEHPEKQIRMNSCITLAMIWELFHDVGLFRKYKGTVKLSKIGKAVKGRPKLIALHLFYALQTIADTSILDGYEYFGFNESLEKVGEMLYSFGDEYHPASFYGEKYAEEDSDFGYLYKLTLETDRDRLMHCFEVRIMVRFFEWFGLVEHSKSYFDNEKNLYVVSKYKTTPLFKKLIGMDKVKEKITYPLFYLDNQFKS